jgi:hypothetical protein
VVNALIKVAIAKAEAGVVKTEVAVVKTEGPRNFFSVKSSD